MIYTKADLKNIQITKEKLKDRKVVIEQLEPVLIQKIVRQLKKLFSIIKLNDDKIDTAYFDKIIETKFSHIPSKLDVFYDEYGIERIEEVEEIGEKQKENNQNFENENREDFPFHDYLKHFGKLPLDKQIVELFALYQVMYYGQQYQQIDEYELEEYSLEFFDLLRSLTLLGWPVYEGMHILSQAILTLCPDEINIANTNKNTPFEKKDVLVSYLHFASDVETCLFSYCYLSEDMQDQTVYDMHQVLVENFRLTVEQYNQFYKEPDVEEYENSKREFYSLLLDLGCQFSHLVKENRLDILQTIRSRLLFYKEVLQLQNLYNVNFPNTIKDEIDYNDMEEICVFSYEDHLESINYFQMMFDYFYALNEAINTYAKRKYVLKRTTILSEEDILNMIKEFHLDELDMYDYFEEYGKNESFIDSYKVEEYDLSQVS